MSLQAWSRKGAAACIAEELVHLMRHASKSARRSCGAGVAFGGVSMLMRAPCLRKSVFDGASRRQVLLGDTRGQGKSCEERVCQGRHRRVST